MSAQTGNLFSEGLVISISMMRSDGDLPSEVIVGTTEGLKHESAVNLAHMQIRSLNVSISPGRSTVLSRDRCEQDAGQFHVLCTLGFLGRNPAGICDGPCWESLELMPVSFRSPIKSRCPDVKPFHNL